MPGSRTKQSSNRAVISVPDVGEEGSSSSASFSSVVLGTASDAQIIPATPIQPTAVSPLVQPVSRPIIKLTYFSSSSECSALAFLQNFEMVAAANGWSNDMKLQFFPCYLKDTSALWFQTFRHRHPQHDWDFLTSS